MQRSRLYAVAATLAAGVSFAGIGAIAGSALNPGFNPNTGQINSGVTHHWPSGAPPGAMAQSGPGDTVKDIAKPVGATTAAGMPIPSRAEALALPAIGSKDPSSGQAAVAATPPANGASPSAAAPASDSKKASAAAGANDAEAAAGAPASGSATTGAAPAEQPIIAIGLTAGPIGATAQTMPAKFSPRNDALDKLPTLEPTP